MGLGPPEPIRIRAGAPTVIKIEVASDFSRTPGPRFKKLGPHSGEEFRDRIVTALQSAPTESVEVFLDGTEGYGSSFLEEAFGGLVRHSPYSPDEISRRVKIRAHTRLYQTYADEAERYLEEAVRVKKA